MFAKALAGGFAVGAFNINNMETVQGILQAAGDERSPVILQVSNGARQYAGRGYLRKMAEAASEETDVPFVLHLDHGSGFDICKACIDDGFTSVMIDGSHLPFEENVAVTRRVVEYAHDRGSGSKPNSDGSPGSRKPFRPANPFIPIPKRQKHL